MGFAIFIGRLALFVAVLGLIEILLNKYLNRPLWKSRWGKRLVIGWPIASTLALVAWGVFVAVLGNAWWLDTVSRIIAAAFLVGLLGLVLSAPLAGLLNGLEALRVRFFGRLPQPGHSGSVSAPADSPVSPQRRSFLQLGALALPLAAVSASQSGVLKSFSGVRIFELPLKIPDLPPQLEGFRILHLCDMHLGVFYQLGDLEQLLTELSHYEYDLVTAVGDVADNLDSLPTALRLISQLNSRFGHVATLGNHEYYRGLERVLGIYERSSVPLLRNQGLKFDIDGASLVVGGADDPVVMGWTGDRTNFYRNAVEKSLDVAGSGDTRILLSHRPGAFDFAAKENVQLTLAGHTHGGQLGVFGRSVIDYFGDDFYLWGRYQNENSQLYTSSGVGHWFPFRLGCPAEAPIIILQRA